MAEEIACNWESIMLLVAQNHQRSVFHKFLSLVSPFCVVLDVGRCVFIEAIYNSCLRQSGSFIAEIIDHMARKKLCVL